MDTKIYINILIQNESKDLDNYSDINYEDFNSYLEFEDDNAFLEWYSIEGKNQIFELSRKLRIFLNYKKSMLHLRPSSN